MKSPIAGLMQQAQRMQEEMKRAQEEIAQAEVTGQSGGGIVSVVMSGRHEVRRVNIDRKVLADLAVHDRPAFNKIAEQAKASLA